MAISLFRKPISSVGMRGGSPMTRPDRLLALVRAHWGIENRLHHVRDVTMDENRCCVRVGGRVLASICNLGLSLIRACCMPVRKARENSAKAAPSHRHRLFL